jgi:hypothetical protein
LLPTAFFVIMVEVMSLPALSEQIGAFTMGLLAFGFANIIFTYLLSQMFSN